MEESFPNMVDDRVKELTKTQVPLYVAEGLIIEIKQNQADVAKMITNAIKEECENLRVEITSQINNAITNHIPSQVDSSVRSYISSAIRLRDQDDTYDDVHLERENSAKRQKTSEHGTYVMGESSSDDDELPTENVSQELVEEMLETVDEATLKEILSLPFPQEPIPVIQSCQRDPKAPALSRVNQDLMYLKKGNSGPEKIMLSLHNVKHWKNPHVKIFYFKRQKELGKPIDEVYSNSKIVQVIKTTGELGHEYKFVTKIIARRANGSIVSITEPDYKNLNKNDIEDMYLLCINGKLGVESYQQKVNLTAPTITFFGIKKHKMFSIISKPVYGIIYKKENRVMRHQEIHKFCDATLKRVLEGLKSYNNDVKHGYVTPSLSKEDAEYLQLFEEEIKERLKHREQMRRWEMYVNRRPR
ncbi:hypothetical protein Tco_1253273 [Tanacetum coccineum]